MALECLVRCWWSTPSGIAIPQWGYFRLMVKELAANQKPLFWGLKTILELSSGWPDLLWLPR